MKALALVTAFAIHAIALFPLHIEGQGWSLDALGGRARSDVGLFDLNSATAAVALRYGAGLTWVIGSIGVPVEKGDPVWGVMGGGGRFERGDRLHLGVDLSTQLFGQDDRATPDQRRRRGDMAPDPDPDLSGTAAVVSLSPFLGWTVGSTMIEAHARLSGYHSSFAGLNSDRVTVAPTLRVFITPNPSIALLPEARWVRAENGDFPQVSLTAAWSGTRGRLWARAGRWLRDSLAVQGSWDVGATFRLSDRVEALASGGRDAFSPLYETGERQSWSIGVRMRLGAARSRSATPFSSPKSFPSGLVRLSLSDTELPDGTRIPSIAGDFSGWVSLPMIHVGDEWRVELNLEPGAYHYAFVSDSGDWFVPASAQGRTADGFGGFSAVLVVGGHRP